MITNLKNQKGFTLLEILLAVILFSLVAGIIAGAFFIGLNIQESTAHQGERHNTVFWTLDALTTDLHNVASYNFSGSYPERSSFTGSARSLALVTRKGGRLRHVRYVLRLKSSGKIHKTLLGRRHSKNLDRTLTRGSEQNFYILWRTEQSFAAFLAGTQDNLTEEILMENITQNFLNFTYVDQSDPGQSRIFSQWQEDHPPQAVHVTFGGGEDKRFSLVERTILIFPNGI